LFSCLGIFVILLIRCENIISFVNNVKTVDGGTHELGFKSALTRILNDYAKKNNILKSKDKTFEGSDVREGLTAIISVKIPESILQFESQTKSKLGTPIARSSVDTVVSEKLPFYLEENNKIASILLDKIQKSKQAREAARKAREDIRKGKNSSKNPTVKKVQTLFKKILQPSIWRWQLLKKWIILQKPKAMCT